MKISEYYSKLQDLFEDTVTVGDWSLSVPQLPGESNGFIAPLTDIYYYKDNSLNTYASATQQIVINYVVDNDVPYHQINLGIFQGIYNDVVMRLLMAQTNLDLINIQNKSGSGLEISELTEGYGYWLITLRFDFSIQWVTEYETYVEPKYDITRIESSLFRSTVTDDTDSHLPNILDQGLDLVLPPDTSIPVPVPEVIVSPNYWTPAALGSRIIAWYSAEDTSDNGSLTLLDKSGNGNHAVEFTDTAIVGDDGWLTLDGSRFAMPDMQPHAAVLVTKDIVASPGFTDKAGMYGQNNIQNHMEGLLFLLNTNNGHARATGWGDGVETGAEIMLRVNGYYGNYGKESTVPGLVNGVILGPRVSVVGYGVANRTINLLGSFRLPDGAYRDTTGKVAEYIFTNNPLEYIDIIKLEGYYYHKLGIPIPNWHPYYNNPPLLED